MTTEQQIARAREVFDVEIKGLQATRDSLGDSFAEAIAMMLDCVRRDGIVVVSGVGKNLHVAEKMSAIFASTGTRSIVLNPVQAMHGDLGMVSSRDILIALSFSGESAEVNNLIPAIRRHGLKVISMTGRPESTLAKLSDVHIEIPCGKEACPFGMAPTNSTTATMAMGDALAMVMIDAQKFELSSYAMNHPAGAIGRALVMKVADIMRTGEKLATVAPTATVMETVMAMTAAKSGAAVVVDEEGKLKGIFTDGDFRRLMSGKRNDRMGENNRITELPNDRMRQEDQSSTDNSVIQSFGHSVISHSVIQSFGHSVIILGDPIAEHMTSSPMFVRDTAYAAELLKVFEKKHIDDLPVCDANGKVVGLVDIQDLPKMKVL